MKRMQRPFGWCAVFVFWVLGAILLLKIWNYLEAAARSAWLLH